MDFKSKIILIYGPTASGKSKFAVELAKKINGEIINADSMQVYKELKILSAHQNLMAIRPYTRPSSDRIVIGLKFKSVPKKCTRLPSMAWPPIGITNKEPASDRVENSAG